MNALTILLEIKGSCHILGQHFDLHLHNDTFILKQNQKQFFICKQLPVENSWNTISITHTNHADDLTLLDTNQNILDFSYVSFDSIRINNYEISNAMWKNSGGKTFNPFTNKQLQLYKLGEPFCLTINFYFPLEFWTFALADSKNNYGKIGWK